MSESLIACRRQIWSLSRAVPPESTGEEPRGCAFGRSKEPRSLTLIGRKATIVGYSDKGDSVSPDNEAVAHICLDIEGGMRVFFEATDPAHEWRIVEEPYA